MDEVHKHDQYLPWRWDATLGRANAGVARGDCGVGRGGGTPSGTPACRVPTHGDALCRHRVTPVTRGKTGLDTAGTSACAASAEGALLAQRVSDRTSESAPVDAARLAA